MSTMETCQRCGGSGIYGLYRKYGDKGSCWACLGVGRTTPEKGHANVVRIFALTKTTQGQERK